MVKTGRHLTLISKLIQHRFLPTVFAMIVLAVGLLISVVLSQQIRAQQNEQITAALEFSADSTLKNIQSLLETYTVVMHGVQGYFRGSEYIDFDEFAEYVGSLQVEDKLPGVQAINLAIKILDQDKHEHHDEIRYWFPDYNIHPEGRRESYVPIVRTEPLNEENLKVLGLDLLTVPTAWHAMQRARDTGTVAITAPLSLVQDDQLQDLPAFVMYLPIYDKGTDPQTIEERQAAIVGWVDVPFRMLDLVSSLVGEIDPMIDLEIYDISTPNVPLLMYDSDELNYRDRVNAGYFQTQRVLAFGGREWALHSSSTKAFEQRIVNRNLVLIIFAISLLLTITLAWLVWLLITQKQQAEVWFEKLFQQIAEGIVVIDNKHQIVEMNPAARQIFSVNEKAQSFPMLNQWFRHDAAMMTALNDVRKGIPITIETSVASNGTMLPLNVQMQPLDDGYYFLTIVDLTEQKEKTRRIERLTHIYQALSETNQAIVRMDDTRELLPLVCRCAVSSVKCNWPG